MADRYDLVPSPAPAPKEVFDGDPSRRPLSDLEKALIEVAEKFPRQEVRIAEHKTAESARVAAYRLERRERGRRRPEGTWEFSHGPIVDEDGIPTGTYGVWTKFTPPKKAAKRTT